MRKEGIGLSKECEEIKVLLPWLINDSLEGEEKFTALSHLASCSNCRKELAFVVNMNKAAECDQQEKALDSKASTALFDVIAERIKEAEEVPNIKLEQVHEQEIASNLAPLAITGTVLNSVRRLLGNEAARVGDDLRPAAEGLKLYIRLMGAGMANMA